MQTETLLNRQAQAVVDRQAIPELLTIALIQKHFVPAGGRTLHRWISAGKFPRPDIALGGKIRYWKIGTVRAWIDARAAEGASL
jgi:predicted DNA-binding transcriptional regulator AlpA